MRMTRRQLVAGAAAGAAAAGGAGFGLYELVDRLTGKPVRRRDAGSALPREQHVLDGLAVIDQDGVEVVVPPLHHAVVTGTVAATNLRAAQRELEDALRQLEARHAPSPSGLGVT